RALHDEGYHVLLFDLRNHGESARKVPITYGPNEALDYRGALAYVRSRADVDPARIGVLGCSMGANAALYGTPDAQPVKAIPAGPRPSQHPGALPALAARDPAHGPGQRQRVGGRGQRHVLLRAACEERPAAHVEDVVDHPLVALQEPVLGHLAVLEVEDADGVA